VIDPRRTETADASDLHLQLRPGTDAYVLAAMLAIILRRGGEARAFLAGHTTGFAPAGTPFNAELVLREVALPAHGTFR